MSVRHVELRPVLFSLQRVSVWSKCFTLKADGQYDAAERQSFLLLLFFFLPVADLSQSAPQSQTQTQRSGSDAAQTPRRLDLCVLTLSERLEQYYRSRVCLSPSEVSRAQQRALDIATEIQAFLHSKHPDMPRGEMTLAGSLLDDLQVVRADHACLLVPLQVAGSKLP